LLRLQAHICKLILIDEKYVGYWIILYALIHDVCFEKNSLKTKAKSKTPASGFLAELSNAPIILLKGNPSSESKENFLCLENIVVT
jgi:hypothetical protein